MTKIISTIALLTFLMTNNIYSQIPHLEGKIIVSIKSGTIDAELTLKNLPKTDNYTIWLNAGLNIEYFKEFYPLKITERNDIHSAGGSG